MEKCVLNEDIKTLCITATSFPDGVLAAHQKLHALFPDRKNRQFFGISYPNGKGTIIYKAAVKEAYSGEAEKYGCDTFVLKKGTYISKTIRDFRKDIPQIGKTFTELLN
ncbi:MAG: transcriptional regulator, partial [Flavisolibacter sp.]|nr:transcriptional regulator [Flavisolibacter sp.]